MDWLWDVLGWGWGGPVVGVGVVVVGVWLVLGVVVAVFRLDERGERW